MGLLKTKAVKTMFEDTAYIEVELYTEEDWEDMILMAEIEMRHPRDAREEAHNAETAE